MMMYMTIAIEWPDGTTTSGATPEEVFAKIAKAQWQPVEPADVPRLLVDRAWIWSGEEVDEDLPLEVLIQRLAQAGMFRIVDWG
jgi:hypothetical protein